MKKRMLVGLLVLAAIAVLSGCSGGGWIPGGGYFTNTSGATFHGATQSGKATFGFTYDGYKGRFQGTYRDGDVQIAFTGPSYSAPSPSCIASSFDYRSTNPFWRGTGTGQIYACDAGEPGFSSGDTLDISINSGPFNGYSNSGTVQGNIQVK